MRRLYYERRSDKQHATRSLQRVSGNLVRATKVTATPKIYADADAQPRQNVKPSKEATSSIVTTSAQLDAMFSPT
jgi:hypothetical protein